MIGYLHTYDFGVFLLTCGETNVLIEREMGVYIDVSAVYTCEFQCI